MSEQGVGLGTAVRRCEYRIYGVDANETPLRRRFDGAVMASDVATLQQRLRSLVGQMRGEAVALDYPQLAKDLYSWQCPGGADAVRRRWARQYYRVGPESTPHHNATSEAQGPTYLEED